MKKKKLLIAGGGHADIPMILAGKRMGFHVITTGNRPDELGHQYSDEYYNADFSNPDVILALARDLEVSAICPCCNDFSAISSAFAAQILGLPGHDLVETVKILHHKDLFRAFSIEHGFPVPAAKGVTSIKEGLEAIHHFPLPVIVKPVDLTGGKGVSTVRRIDEAEVALKRAFTISRAKRVVVEEFIEGSRHGFSAFLVDGRVVFSFMDNEHYYINPYLVAAASTPSFAGADVHAQLCSISERYASLLHLKTGIFHVQFILRHGKPVIIEICRRPPGDLYVRFVEIATGVDYARWIVKAFAGLDCSEASHAEPQGCFVRHCVMASSAGRLKDIVIDAKIERHIIESLWWWKPGDWVDDVRTTKFGIVFLKFDSPNEMLEMEERMHLLIRPEIE